MQFLQFTYALLSRHPEFLPANHITNIIDMSIQLNSFTADFNSFSRIMTDKTIVFALSRDSKRGYTFDIRFAPTTANGKIGKHSIQHLSFDSTCYMRLTFSGILSVHRTASTVKLKRKKKKKTFCPLPGTVDRCIFVMRFGEEKWPAKTIPKRKGYDFRLSIIGNYRMLN